MNNPEFKGPLSRLGWLAGLALMFAVAAPAMAGTTPDQLVKQTADQVLKKVLANKEGMKADSSRLYNLVNSDVLPHFDFEMMSQRVLGKYWRTATPGEQGSFVKEFRQLLVRTYATALLNYSGQEIEYKPFRMTAGDRTAVVRTAVRNSGSPAIPIDYRLYINKAGQWKVFDLKIDGVSLVSNYRTSFGGEVRQIGVGGLVKKLAQRNAGKGG
ncbi:MAG: ABC transporter substrate-binding protein [Gammaproteobacteria bacterium]|nr:ABC transporter substrate-binding protein [Gammaproteobacteria bacterium]MBU1656060.1 ABC transporter substrate-binding protein [Gammaproteobacteria bacterium]MBU1961239.1 ABC transporter substrate-binding protein [Gammaproteobacteria bacterium]